MESTASLRFLKSLFVDGALTVANGLATWSAQFKGRINEIELSLRTTGATSGATTVDVKKNGVTILSAVFSVAQGAATKFVRTAPGGAGPSLVLGPAGGGEPSGVDFVEGDLFTVDVTAIPGTASAGLTMDLSGIAKNV